ncbi:GD15940 [Drosophila simulans]|uniref:GD15940 n=1 Tax=Drosophila simulans TaxID=7240 RepID=B4R3M3_DROSI|nr:GD15940 [Drosophila simulans]
MARSDGISEEQHCRNGASCTCIAFRPSAGDGQSQNQKQVQDAGTKDQGPGVRQKP